MIKKMVALSILLLATPTPASAEWEFKDRIDPLTDERSGSVTAQGEDASISVFCDKRDGKLFILILSQHYLGEGRYPNRQIRYRVDAGKAKTIYGDHYKSSALVAINRRNDAGFRMLKEIATGQNLVVQLTSFDYSVYTTTIDISGFQTVFPQVSEACGTA